MLAPGSAAVAAEVVHAVRNEFARSVEDILLRRTMLGLDADLGAAVVSTTATLAAAELGWTATQTETQIQSYLCEIDRRRPPRLDHVQSAR
jgi:glycerol-3-phosphate dehydrogenase